MPVLKTSAMINSSPYPTLFEAPTGMAVIGGTNDSMAPHGLPRPVAVDLDMVPHLGCKRCLSFSPVPVQASRHASTCVHGGRVWPLTSPALLGAAPVFLLLSHPTCSHEASSWRPSPEEVVQRGVAIEWVSTGGLHLTASILHPKTS